MVPPLMPHRRFFTGAGVVNKAAARPQALLEVCGPGGGWHDLRTVPSRWRAGRGCVVLVVSRELERCAVAWEDAADDVEVLVRVLAELDAGVLGEAEQAGVAFVAASVRWVEALAVLARARAAGLREWADDVARTDRAVASALAGGGSW